MQRSGDKPCYLHTNEVATTQGRTTSALTEAMECSNTGCQQHNSSTVVPKQVSRSARIASTQVEVGLTMVGHMVE